MHKVKQDYLHLICACWLRNNRNALSPDPLVHNTLRYVYESIAPDNKQEFDPVWRGFHVAFVPGDVHKHGKHMPAAYIRPARESE